MTQQGRADPDEYRTLELRVHTLLHDVPLHDVWVVELPGGGAGRTVADLRPLLSAERLSSINGAVRFLFWLRGWLGRVFRWDREPARVRESSYAARLTEEERQASLVPTGAADGPFQVLYVTPREAVSEIQNATVHAFSVFALLPRLEGYRLYWAIYVLPVGGLTRWYMALIDPFRRLIIYPAVLRYLRGAWARAFA